MMDYETERFIINILLIVTMFVCVYYIYILLLWG